jgi:hypothetical protein
MKAFPVLIIMTCIVAPTGAALAEGPPIAKVFVNGGTFPCVSSTSTSPQGVFIVDDGTHRVFACLGLSPTPPPSPQCRCIKTPGTLSGIPIEVIKINSCDSSGECRPITQFSAPFRPDLGFEMNLLNECEAELATVEECR